MTPEIHPSEHPSGGSPVRNPSDPRLTRPTLKNKPVRQPGEFTRPGGDVCKTSLRRVTGDQGPSDGGVGNCNDDRCGQGPSKASQQVAPGTAPSRMPFLRGSPFPALTAELAHPAGPPCELDRCFSRAERRSAADDSSAGAR